MNNFILLSYAVFLGLGMIGTFISALLAIFYDEGDQPSITRFWWFLAFLTTIWFNIWIVIIMNHIGG